MDADSEEMPVQRGKLRQRSSGNWYVQCRWCDKEARLEAPNEEEAYGMLHEFHQRGDPIPSAPARTSQRREVMMMIRSE